MAGHDTRSRTLVELPSGIDVTTTVHTYTGTTDGPTLYVQAAQHGREINGTAVLQRLHQQLDPEQLRGTLIAVPVANPLTFDRQSYTVPEPIDRVNPNMNRVWPGQAHGGIHQRMAARLWELAVEADAVVDLHTATAATYPHVVYTAGDTDSKQLATAFGTDLVLAEPPPEDGDDTWLARGFDRKFRAAAVGHDIPAITPELGMSRQLTEQAITTGVDGLFSILNVLEMYPDTGQPSTSPMVRSNAAGRIHADHSGLFVPARDITVGERVPAGDALGRIVDPASYTVKEHIEATTAGILYMLTREATVNAGDQLAAIAPPPA